MNRGKEIREGRKGKGREKVKGKRQKQRKRERERKEKKYLASITGGTAHGLSITRTSC